MSDLTDDISHWALGVVSSAEPDRAELKNAMTRGDNAQFTSIASGIASPRKRRGMTVMNRIPFSASGSYANTVLADSPEAFWRLNESSGTSAVDASGNNHTGTYTNGPTLGVASAVEGNTAVRFDGANDHIVVTGMPAMTQITFEAWVYSTSIATDQIFVSAGGFARNYLRIQTSKAFVSLDISGVQRTLFGATTLLSNTWYHLAATYDGATLKVYVNGVLDGSDAYTGSLTDWGAATTVNIGRYVSATNYFVGTLDEVAIYPTALTAAQVLAHHRSYTAPAGPAVVAGFPYKYNNAGTRVNYIVLVQANGDVQLVLDDGSSTTHAATATCATPGLFKKLLGNPC